MRIVAVADTHTFERDLGTLPEGDLLVHAGDMLRGGTLEELGPMAEWFNAQPHAHKIIVPGNHDVCFQTQPDEARALVDATVLVDSGVTLGGLTFWGSPWQPQHPDWGYHCPPESIGAKWALVPAGTDVLITHTPGRGIGDRASGHGRVGCRALAEAGRRIQARMHLFGHVHQEGGAWLHDGRWQMNVTTWESERAATVFDITADEVRLIEVPPTDPMAVQRAAADAAAAD